MKTSNSNKGFFAQVALEEHFEQSSGTAVAGGTDTLGEVAMEAYADLQEIATEGEAAEYAIGRVSAIHAGLETSETEVDESLVMFSLESLTERLAGDEFPSLEADGVMGSAKVALKKAWHAIVDFFKKIKDWITEKFAKFMDWLGKAAQYFRDKNNALDELENTDVIKYKGYGIESLDKGAGDAPNETSESEIEKAAETKVEINLAGKIYKYDPIKGVSVKPNKNDKIGEQTVKVEDAKKFAEDLFDNLSTYHQERDKVKKALRPDRPFEATDTPSAAEIKEAKKAMKASKYASKFALKFMAALASAGKAEYARINEAAKKMVKAKEKAEDA